MEEHSGIWGLVKHLKGFLKHFRFGKGTVNFAKWFSPYSGILLYVKGNQFI
jgi:hypothetical protein